MEILLVCAYSILITYDLVNSWVVLIERKKRVFLQVGLAATVLLFLYIGLGIFPTISANNLRGSFLGWYALGYTLLTTYSVYVFVIWTIMSFSIVKEINTAKRPVQYGLRHAAFLLIGSCSACYLTILGNYYLFPPSGVSLIDIFWVLIYFIFLIIVMIRMIWGEKVDFGSLVRVLFSCVMGFQLLLFIMLLADQLVQRLNS
ncbi:hypothetical protein [Dyadobacter sp. CY356]|uniref:hypothetical protein n=1 Tax=Dyadobacter sp. CY356 TaxID=2906442 RepID=UPI001F3C0396|nr:hypothetical protein [Dyadobacter sp. CY356]MCF0057893.1 hypothetical protein [Dyadobacter sp. CY356]